MSDTSTPIITSNNMSLGTWEDKTEAWGNGVITLNTWKSSLDTKIYGWATRAGFNINYEGGNYIEWGKVYLDSNQDGIFQIETDELIVHFYKAAHANTSTGTWSRDVNLDGGYVYDLNSKLLGIYEVIVPLKFDVTANNDELVGTAINDDIQSLAGNDFINSRPGNDTITGGEGNDTIDGGSGSDTSIYSGKFSDYSFTRESNSLKIADQRTGANDGTDTLSNIEYIQFTDQTVEESKVDIVKTYSGEFSDYKFYNKGNGVYQIKTNSGYDDITGLPLLTFTGEASTSSFRNVSAIIDIKGTFDQVTGLETDDAKMFRLYNAAFKRLPDADGLKYWIEKYSSGENDERAVASSFLVSAEFKQRYGENVSDTIYLNNLYQNVLGRLPDTSGLNYWLGQLSSGDETRYEVLLGFSESDENKTLFTEMTGFV